MDNRQTEREALLTDVINLFSEIFRDKAVLHGGMVLRLLDCPRLTNDVDYVFVPFKSKNDVCPSILSALRSLPGVTISHSLNSKCLRIIISRDQVVTKAEIKVDTTCRTTVLVSSTLARAHGRPARAVQVMDFSVALANKLSAWLDRRLMRDWYDIHFLLNLGVKPDLEILKKRLAKPVYARTVQPFPGKPPISVPAFLDFLKAEALKLDDKTLSESLSEVLPETDLIGLAMRIKASVTSKL